MIISAIRARIRQRLELLDKSMEAASKEAGLSEAYLKGFMAERQKDITVSKLELLAPTLKTTAVWLLTGEGDADVQPDPDTAAVIGLVPHLKKRNLERAREYLEMLKQAQDTEKAKG